MPRRLMSILVLVAALASPLWAGEPFHVMIVNDDGVDAPGIAALAAELSKDTSYRVVVVAPATHQSGMGHAVVTNGPIVVRRHDPVGGCPAWSVGGTPATTARMGVAALLADDPPDLVLSGINRGENDGILAWYSGTVGAAREAVIAGFPAVAFSLELNWSDPHPDFAAAARLAKPVVDAVRRHPLPPGVLLNVNIPRDTNSVKGYRLARMSIARSKHEGFVQVETREDGARLYQPKWRPAQNEDQGTDTWALDAGWVTVVPLGLDQTRLDAFPVMGWVVSLQLPAMPEPSPQGQ
jgi:5'-nucleotidase